MSFLDGLIAQDPAEFAALQTQVAEHETDIAQLRADLEEAASGEAIEDLEALTATHTTQIAGLGTTNTSQDAAIGAAGAAAAAAQSTANAAAAAVALLGSRLVQPLPFIVPDGGWDTSFDFDGRVATNPDLAVNGWTIALTHSPYTVLTRAGDVRWMDHVWAAAAGAPAAGTTTNYPPAAGTYYSTLVGGRLLIQIPGQTDVSIYRAASAVGGAVFSAGVGGGAFTDNGRQLYLSNGAPGTAGVTCAFVSDTGPNGVSASGASLAGFIGSSPNAVHMALEAAAYLNGPADKPPGRYIRPAHRPLFGQGANALSGGGSLLDTGHGMSGAAATSRCALRLMAGPVSYFSAPSAPIELFYIRRRPHRAHAYW